jgi:KaiC/GvpD/RAD55 family RecA-like ATPase
MAQFQTDYEYLVAAFALRDPEFAATYGRVLSKVGDSFFGHYALPDVVKHGLTYFLNQGEFLPPEALKADLAFMGRDSVHRSTYDEAIDAIFKAKLQGKKHVEDTVVKQARMRLLASLGDPADWILEGRYDDYMGQIKLIDGIGRSHTDDLLLLADDFDVLIQDAPDGIPIGLPGIDENLNGGGLCPGELMLVLGRYNVGKSQFLNNACVNAARWMLENEEPGTVFFVSFETSLRNTRMRLAKTALGWTDDQIKQQPALFQDLVRDELTRLPILVKYTSGFEYTFSHLENDIKQAEKRTGIPVKMVIRDYGELMCEDPDDYRSVRKSYKGFKDFVGKHEITGLDAAQKNRNGKISHFNLLKDADVLLDLEKPQGSDSQIICTIERNREGPAGKSILLAVDRASGKMKQHTRCVEELDEDELRGDSNKHGSED